MEILRSETPGQLAFRNIQEIVDRHNAICKAHDFATQSSPLPETPGGIITAKAPEIVPLGGDDLYAQMVANAARTGAKLPPLKKKITEPEHLHAPDVMGAITAEVDGAVSNTFKISGDILDIAMLTDILESTLHIQCKPTEGNGKSAILVQEHQRDDFARKFQKALALFRQQRGMEDINVAQALD